MKCRHSSNIQRVKQVITHRFICGLMRHFIKMHVLVVCVRVLPVCICISFHLNDQHHICHHLFIIQFSSVHSVRNFTEFLFFSSFSHNFFASFNNSMQFYIFGHIGSLVYFNYFIVFRWIVSFRTPDITSLYIEIICPLCDEFCMLFYNLFLFEFFRIFFNS